MPDSPDVLPLQLLQPLDANQQGSEPTPLGGVHRPLVSPDPGVHHPAGAAAAGGGGGDERGWRSSRLRIHRNGQVRSIWAVHLPGWQQLGWQLLPPAAVADSPELPAGSPRAVAGEPAADVPSAAGQQPDSDVLAAPAPPEAEPSDPEALTATELTAPAEVPNFQAMTKAQIISHCLSSYGVSLDGDRTKADLVAAATALAAGETEAVNEAAADADAVADPDPNADPEPLLTQTVDDPAAGGDLSLALADPIDLQLPDDLL